MLALHVGIHLTRGGWLGEGRVKFEREGCGREREREGERGREGKRKEDSSRRMEGKRRERESTGGES